MPGPNYLQASNYLKLFETLLFSRPHQGYVKVNNVCTSIQIWNTLKDMAHNS